MKVRKPAVAGTFYPGDSRDLKTIVDDFLENTDTHHQFEKIAGIISPHAGYIFSGPTAAEAYHTIAKLRPKYIIVLAPSHREYIQGFSLYPGDYYETPLGKIKIDTQLVNQISQNQYAEKTEIGHNSEHSLEVQLPFLQTIYDHDFNLIPIVIGDVNIKMLDSLAKTIYELSINKDILVIASSDLSHFHSYKLARQIDLEFLDMLQKYDLAELGEGILDNTLEACGITAIYTLMKYASLKGHAKCKILDYKNSGDTAGDKFRVVGYGAGVIYNE